MWLCDRLKEYVYTSTLSTWNFWMMLTWPCRYASEWESRNDLTPRAYGMVKLDPEIKVLQSFGKRAYTNEMTSQRTIVNDILGGESHSPSNHSHLTHHRRSKFPPRSSERRTRIRHRLSHLPHPPNGRNVEEDPSLLRLGFRCGLPR